MQINIISIAGGLGNQMFQYAFYISLKNKSKYTYYWVAPYKRHNGFELENVFGIINNIFLNNLLKIIKFSSRYFGVKHEEIEWGNFSYFSSSKFLIYHSGYWQSEKYFNQIQDIIRKSYEFDETKLNKGSKVILEKINSVISVSIHIRRGDYLSDTGASKLLGNICTLNYYTKAIEYLTETLSNNISFFVFSDDINWVKNTFTNYNLIYIDCNLCENSWMDMFLMSKCNHNIIANSSFSWWGAWLNNYPDKIVVCPNKWFKHQDAIDIIPKSWISISP
jgi:hypothetical protein